MTHAVRLVAVGVPVQAQTPEIDTLRARAEAGVASAPFTLAFMYSAGQGVRQCEGRNVKSVISRMFP
jgi:hypothetical protein